jgi:uncharacterized protein with GYD domain
MSTDEYSGTQLVYAADKRASKTISVFVPSAGSVRTSMLNTFRVMSRLKVDV